MGLKRGGLVKAKNPPIFSHEFVVQNHADIVSCVAMVFVCLLIFQATAPFASSFMAIGHNVTEAVDPSIPVLYTYGPKDLCMIFFYFLICIVMHAIIQEYILDKVNRKMHLSKVKHSKFNESGQLLLFYLISVLWGGDIVFRENYALNIAQLWDGYPHHEMTFMFKFFFIIQLCYWLHCYPELYFQKTKKEEMASRVTYASLYLIFLSAAYVLNFTRLALCLILMHYTAECVFHVARLLYYAEKSKAAEITFMVYNGGFVLSRLGSITLSVLSFWYGLALSGNEGIDLQTSNFNTQTIRINCLVSVCLVQAWLMWNFITFHLKKMRERAALLTKKKPGIGKALKKNRRDEAFGSFYSFKRNSEEDVNELPEVDQNTKVMAMRRAKMSTSGSTGRGRK